MNNPSDVVILAGARAPQGRLNGQLSGFTAVELGAMAIAAALECSGVDAGGVGAVIMGQGLQAGRVRILPVKVPSVPASGGRCRP